MGNVPKYEIEKHYKVYDNEDGVCINVGPDGELGCVQVRTADKKSEEWYGKLDFMLAPAAAMALGKALVQSAQDLIDAEKGK